MLDLGVQNKNYRLLLTFDKKSIQPKNYLQILQKITTKIFFWLDCIVKNSFFIFCGFCGFCGFVVFVVLWFLWSTTNNDYQNEKKVFLFFVVFVVFVVFV